MAATALRSITMVKWGSVNGQEIEKYTLTNSNNQEVDVVTYGATVTAIRTPDKEGNIADVVLGFDNVEGNLITFIKNIQQINPVDYMACSLKKKKI